MKRLISLLLTFAAIFAFAIPMADAAPARTQKQEAVLQTALAYYYRGYPVQYDSEPITAYGKYDGGPIRGGYTFSPEDATADNICYSVCSDYMLEVYHDAFDWMFMDSILNCKTSNILKLKEDDPMVVYRYDPADKAYAGKTMDAAREESRRILQCGDVFVTRGHAMMYIGDYKDDGHEYVIHCWGGKYDFTKGTDKVESKQIIATGNGGSIRIDDVDEFIYNAGAKYDMHKSSSFIIVRPLNALQSTPLTENAQARLKAAGLDIDRTCDHDRYRDVEEGGTITVSLKLKNYGTAACTVPVTQVVPENAALKDAGGASVSGRTLTWNVTVPAGETKELNYSVTAAAKRGDTITLTGGNVAGIRDNTIAVPVGGRHLTAEQQQKLKDIKSYAAVLKGTKGAKFATAVYQNVLGIDVTIESCRNYQKKACETKRYVGVGVMELPLSSVAADFKIAKDMLIPCFFGGSYILTEDAKDRALTFEHSHLYAGDVLVYSKAGTTTDGALVYLGDNKVAWMEDDHLTVTEADPVLLRSLTYDYFFGVRPTLAYDNVNTIPAAPPFTDVKAADWYYSFVRDLYADGTVNGTSATAFTPAGTLTYGQALKLVTLGIGGKEQEKTGAHWASGYLTYAKESGWLDADADLDAPISRLNFCRIAAKAKNITEQPTKNPFTDCADPAVLALNKAGVIGGMTNTTFDPDGPLTRAQISKIVCLLRMI